MECGLAAQSGLGISVIQWAEIKAWQDATGQEGFWLAETVREMSICYVTEFHQSSDPARPAPVAAIMDDGEIRKAVSSQFKAFVRAKS